MPKKIRPILPAPLDSPDRRRLPILLRRAWYGLNQAFRRRIAHLGLTPDQFTALRTILEGDAQGVAQSALAHLMSSDANTMASWLERMERPALVERRPHEKDRRAYRIRVTPVGRKKYEQGRRIALQLQTKILSALPGGRREEFLGHLKKVADACGQAAEKNRAEG